MCTIREEQLDQLLRQVEKPARYIGCETHMIRKTPDQVQVRFAFAFPDLYEIGMSYMGLQLLYHLVNRRTGLYCERVFAPAPDMAALLRETGTPLFTLETKTPLREVDVLGFTLQYEMSYTGILDMLDLSGIPLLAADRGEDMPLIIAGGPCAYNPEPLADFIDVFLIGDGEESLPALLEAYGQAKASGLPRAAFLEQIAGQTGVYVPALYEVTYGEDGTVVAYTPKSVAVPARVQRCILDEIESVDFPTAPLVPLMETVHDRAVVETFRGCTRGCRFCQAGMIYRPVRERSQEKIVELALAQLDHTGHEELSLLSLSTSDHSQFESLALELLAQCKARNVSLSLPSLRLDSFSFRVLHEMQGYRKSGLTFAPEAGTQRLRDVINKGITEADIFGAVEQAIRLGWRHVKLYFMIGLPTETDADLDGIADIADRILDLHRASGVGGRFTVTVSVSNFVPKPHTPFQWVGQDSTEELKRKHNYLTARLKRKGIQFNYHDDAISTFEAAFSRGDRRLGALLLAAHRLGCRLDGWSEHFDEEKWRQAVAESQTDLAFYTTRQRAYDEWLPWDVIDAAVTKTFLQTEAERARQAVTTQDCRQGCVQCGVNRRTICSRGGACRD